ncbi:ABC transporter ATP-binding protein [Paenibacillus contaminans]|uniref:ABC transporter ATP-binding protein n=1 Tax=Paenibacillus contaminans TaxID=450362 RepID=UPI0013143255|nr:ABC transporter ATP-binding protein [Paenibacillus contaminans]
MLTDLLTKRSRRRRTEQGGVKLWPVYVWSLSFLKPYIGLLLLFIAVMIVLSISELVIPKFIQYFIDTLLPERDFQTFYLSIAALAGMVAVILVMHMLYNLLQRHLQEKAGRDLQLSIFRHLRKLGFAYYEQNPVGQTLSFLNTEVGALQNLYRQSFPWMIHEIMFSVIAVTVMVITSPQLSVVVLPCFLIYYLFGPTLERKASVAGKIMSQNRVEENRKSYESVSALAELRASAAEAWDTALYLDKVRIYNASMIRTYWFAFWRGTNRRLTYQLGAIAIFIYGYYLLQHDRLSVGAFVAFLLYYFTAMHRLTAVVTNITEQKVQMYQAERLYRFVQTAPQVDEAAQPLPLPQVRGDIRFENVSFSYGQAKPVLKEFDLTIRAGERVALVGTSGNGKSTALKLIGRFYDPQEGRILLDGIPVEKLSFASLRQSLGYVFQETYMFGTTILGNIRFGNPEASDEQVRAAARMAYAHDFIMQLPDGYDTVVGERGVKLSGGQKQRIAIARMFIRNPAVVLLDEATSALDNASEAEVQKAFDTLLPGRTVIAVAHRLSTVKDFDKIAVIENGRIAELGTYDELSHAGGVFSQLIRGQEQAKESV